MNGPAGTAEQLRLTLKTDFGVDEQTPNLLGGELFLSRLADDMGDEPRTPAEFAAAAKRLIILSTAALLETLPVGSKNINALFASLDRNDASLAILARAIGGPAFGKGFGIELEQIWDETETLPITAEDLAQYAQRPQGTPIAREVTWGHGPTSGASPSA